MELQPTLPEDEPPPLFRTWDQAYLAVLVYLAFLLLTLYFITRAFTY
jgi:hypothetical protein